MVSPVGRFVLWLRWTTRRRRPRPAASEVSTDRVGLDRCRIVYINLDRRPDRREAIEAELQRIGAGHAIRLAAVERPIGAQGCAESHLQALTDWDPEAAELLMVIEDDALFLVDRRHLDQMIEGFMADPSLDVLCLGFNAKYLLPISATLSITSKSLTTSCYVLKRQMRAPLVAVARRSADSFDRGPDGVHIDRAWRRLQRRWFFAIPRVRAVQQRPSFSDIEGRFVEYRV